jgi:hypothetical protein
MAAAPARAHEVLFLCPRLPPHIFCIHWQLLTPLQVKELLLLRCLASVARRHNCNMILSGDTLESTAAAALCHVAAGR